MIKLPLPSPSAKELLSIFLSPSDSDTAALLDEKWSGLAPHLQSKQQMYGINEEGCGATVGAMPVCNFACKACYLGESANKTPAESISNLEDQLIELRKHLGRWGNLQITDGEVTLRKEADVHEMVRLAYKHELIPMLMTHGDTFIHNPELLYRLVKESGLREVSFHIDSTQKGRKNKKYKYASSESELMELRNEFASLIRSVKEHTGVNLRAASTVTVTSENIAEVPSIVNWFNMNADVFRLLSFQPVADVGRTVDTVTNKVNVDTLWNKIELGLGDSGLKTDDSKRSQWWMGHSECSRFIFGYSFRLKNRKQVFRRFSTRDEDITHKPVLQFYKNWPGITFRADSPLTCVVRALGMLKQKPKFLLFDVPKMFFLMLKEVSNNKPLSLVCDILLKKVTAHRLTIISHHFMSPADLSTPLGKERLTNCIFKVAHKGELVSMCEFNALGGRTEYYRELSERVRQDS